MTPQPAPTLPMARRNAKARSAAECEQLEQLPNVGPAFAADLRRLGILHPHALGTRDAFALYQDLCRATGRRQDPCVLDTFIAVVEFMRGGPARPWWAYTAQRKATYGSI